MGFRRTLDRRIRLGNFLKDLLIFNCTKAFFNTKKTYSLSRFELFGLSCVLSVRESRWVSRKYCDMVSSTGTIGGKKINSGIDDAYFVDIILLCDEQRSAAADRNTCSYS